MEIDKIDLCVGIIDVICLGVFVVSGDFIVMVYVVDDVVVDVVRVEIVGVIEIG